MKSLFIILLLLLLLFLLCILVILVYFFNATDTEIKTDVCEIISDYFKDPAVWSLISRFFDKHFEEYKTVESPLITNYKYPIISPIFTSFIPIIITDIKLFPEITTNTICDKITYNIPSTITLLAKNTNYKRYTILSDIYIIIDATIIYTFDNIRKLELGNINITYSSSNDFINSILEDELTENNNIIKQLLLPLFPINI